MDRNQIIQVLSFLSEGINPNTGEIYDQDSPYQRKEIKRALFLAAYLLNEKDPPLDKKSKELFNKLRKWINGIAIKNNLPAYMVLKDNALTNLAYLQPESIDQLLLSRGIGRTTVEKYGTLIMKLIKEHVEKENAEVNAKTPGNNWKSPTCSWQKRNTEEDRPFRAYASWTKEEDQDLRNLHQQGKSVRQMAEHFARQPGAIRSRLARVGLADVSDSNFTK